MTPMMIFSIGLLQLFAEANIKSANDEKPHSRQDENQVIHTNSGLIRVLYFNPRWPACQFACPSTRWGCGRLTEVEPFGNSNSRGQNAATPAIGVVKKCGQPVKKLLRWTAFLQPPGAS